MKDQVSLVTGGTAGIGLEAARTLAQLGGRVVVVSRNPEKCAATAASLRAETGNAAVDFIPADLSSQKSTRELAAQFQERYDRLDVLINNAGGSFLTRKLSPDGIEMTFALNHLGYFLLTNLLGEVLVRSAPARIVNVSSNAHFGQPLDLKNLELARGYFVFKAYARSKLANVMFTYELARRLKSSRLEGGLVTANVMHPGMVRTNIWASQGWMGKFIVLFLGKKMLTPAQGAETITYLATAAEVGDVTGKYFVNKRPVVSSPASSNQETWEKLWAISAQMTGLEKTIGD